MKILLEILHPHDVHLFKNAIRAWKKRGDEVQIFSREKDCTTELLNELDLPATIISNKAKSGWTLPFELCLRLFRLYKHAKKFKPDILVGSMGVTVCPIGKILKIPSIIFYDTEIASMTNWFTYRLASLVCLPSCYEGTRVGNYLLYPSYQELAYLHPDVFTPDPKIKEQMGLRTDEKFAIIRFVSMDASHDLLKNKIRMEQKIQIVKTLSAQCKVFISSESPLLKDLAVYQYHLPASKFHDSLAAASCMIGDSATITSEAAVLGIPAILISDLSWGYVNEEHRVYGLAFQFGIHETSAAIQCATKILQDPKSPVEFKKKRDRLLSEKENTTNWILRLTDPDFLKSNPQPRRFTPPGFLVRWLAQIHPPKREYPKPARTLKEKELAAVCCYFNSQKSSSRLRNFREFYKKLNSLPTKVPLLIVELAFGDDAFELSEFPNLIQLRTKDLLWQKERLLAIGIERLTKEGYKKVAWLDADIEMLDPYWAERTAEKLDQYKMIQLLGESVRAEEAEYYLSARKGAVRDFLESGKIRMRGVWTGYAWAARTEIFQKVPFYDVSILDGGDVAIWLGAICCSKFPDWEVSVSKIRFYRDLTPGLRKYFLKWAKDFGEVVQGNVGFLEQTVYGMQHGKLKNRFYGDRYWRIPGFDPTKHLQKEANGCWSWTEDAAQFRERTRDFFRLKEDES